MRVAIIGVGNCANSFVQGVHYYRDADPAQIVPGPDARRPRRLPRARHRVHGRLRHRRREGRQGPRRGDLVGPEQHDPLRRRAGAPRRPGAARHDPRRPRQVPLAADHEGARARPPTSSASCATRTPTSSSPTCRSAPSRRPSGTSSRSSRPAARSSTASPSSSRARTTGTSASARRACRSIGDDIKSQVGATIVHRALARLFAERGVEPRAHLAAERRRQHGLLQHARARAARVEEDLEDQRGHVDHGPRAAGRRRPRRPVGLRALADRPQVGPHPPRGPGVRRRAAQPRAQARGLGLAELGRRRDRRGALLQARAQPRRQRPARRPELLPDEVALPPAARRRWRAPTPRSSSRATRWRRRSRRPARRARSSSPRRPRRTATAPSRRRRSVCWRRGVRDRAGLAASVGGAHRARPLRRARSPASWPRAATAS